MTAFRRALASVFSALIIGGLSLGEAPAQSVASARQPMGLTNRVPLPGVVGRMDHLPVDNKHGRVIVAALGNNTVEVVAGFSLRDVHSIPGQDCRRECFTFRTSTSYSSPMKVAR
jgi:hypothetical protein